MSTKTYTVTGMTCQHCVNAVTEEVSGITGVTEVDIDLEGGKVTVTSTSDLDDKTVAEAVDEAGYELVG